METRWAEESEASLPMLLQIELNFTFSAFAEGRSVEVGCNDVYIVQLGDFPELTQKHFCNSSPFRGRVALVNRETCVRTCFLLGSS